MPNTVVDTDVLIVGAGPVWLFLACEFARHGLRSRIIVSVTLDRNGKRETFSAGFVVGCDGAHSAVRQASALAFEGGEYQRHFLLADVKTNETLTASEMHLCSNREGPLAIFPMSANRRCIVAMIEEPEGDAPSLELVQRLLHERAPPAIAAHALHWSSYFHVHHRRVSQLRKGRIFVAGDAAHIHSPFGGQGMNTGLQDVWNLAWRLDLFLRGQGNQASLDSYTAERIPVIKGVIETTDFLTHAMGTPNRLAEALRDTITPMVSRLAPFRHALVQRLSELGIAYRGSPIVEGVGRRYLDDSIHGGSGILGRFLLVLDGKAPTSILETAKRLVKSHAGLLELRLTQRPGTPLVRPDGYIAFSGKTGDSAALASVRSLIGRQTAQA